MKWKQWIEKWGLTGLSINAGFLGLEWQPQDADRSGSHKTPDPVRCAVQLVQSSRYRQHNRFHVEYMMLTSWMHGKQLG
jgi:hypothetical protein